MGFFSDYQDGPPCEFLSSSIHTARKKHLCSFCGLTITPGTKYHYEALRIEGEFTIQKSHLGGCTNLVVEPDPQCDLDDLPF